MRAAPMPVMVVPRDDLSHLGSKPLLEGLCATITTLCSFLSGRASFHWG